MPSGIEVEGLGDNVALMELTAPLLMVTWDWVTEGPRASPLNEPDVTGSYWLRMSAAVVCSADQGNLAATFCAMVFRTSGAGFCSLTTMRRKWEEFLWTQIVPSKTFRSGTICR